jgi:hypothetical protein
MTELKKVPEFERHREQCSCLEPVVVDYGPKGQRIVYAALKDCPECKGTAVREVLVEVWKYPEQFHYDDPDSL